MVLEIIDSISVKLNSVFGDDVRIYGDEDIKQGLNRPCFFIVTINSEQIPYLKNRYQWRNAYDIHYFPETKGGRTECIGVATKLYDAMEFVELKSGDLVHGTSMNYEIQDGILHFFVNYNITMFRDAAKEETVMKEFMLGTDVEKE